MRPSRSFPLLLLLSIPLLARAPAEAAVNQYVEDFTTWAYRDAATTTADWDTLDGEIRLHTFVIEEAGSYDTPGDAVGLAVAGNYAFVADGPTGLVVLEISDPTAPALAGLVGTPGASSHVAVAGDYAYVADADAGLQVVDISVPTAPVVVGSEDLPGVARWVALSGDHAYIACSESGLYVVDITDATEPARVGSLDTTGSSLAVEISGNRAYVADSESGLHVVDVSDPTLPALLGSYDSPGSASGVTIAGDYAFVADGSAGLHVVDVEDPLDPALLGTYVTSGAARDVAVTGDFAYVACEGTGVEVVSVLDPANPALAGSRDTPGIAHGVVVAGHRAYVADGMSGLRVLDVSSADGPILVGTAPSGDAMFVDVEGDFAYVASGDGRVAVIDVSDPENPWTVTSVGDHGYPWCLDAEGDYVYVASGGWGLRVVDVSDPMNPVALGGLDTPGDAYEVAVSGDHAYVAGGGAGLQIIDVSNPTSMTLVGTYGIPGSAWGIAVDGNYAYVAGAGAGLFVIDVTDPTDPQLAGSVDTPDKADAVAISGNYAYVADDQSGLQVVDVSDPGSPVIIGSIDTPGKARGVTVEGDYAYVGGSFQGFHVVDVSDPTNPVLAGTDHPIGELWDTDIEGDFAFVGDKNGRVRVYRIANRVVHALDDVVRSVDISQPDYPVGAARFEASVVDSVVWELSADGAANWMEFRPGGGWQQLTHPGGDLLWRATLVYGGGAVNPTCTDLSIEWLDAHATISSIVDVPDDQGRQVRITWTSSSYDIIGSIKPITRYAVYRRIDPEARAPSSRSTVRSEVPLPLPVEHDDFSPGRGGRWPPGDWDFIIDMPARTEEEYTTVVPTLGDSTATGGMHHSVFFVSAITDTPGIYFDSPPDSGYSIDNLAPGVPAEFAVDYDPAGNHLTWTASPDQDFDMFRIYRSDDPEFVPDPQYLVHSTVGTEWTDETPGGAWHHYRITAVDFAGNESEPAAPGTVTDVEEIEIPAEYAFHQNVPNPFAAGTVIRYGVPTPGAKVTIEIFDVAGRRVRTLRAGLEEPGWKTVAWDRTDAAGHRVASGVYLVRMTAGEFERSLKMAVLK